MENIVTLLKKLGLEKDEASLYLYLLKVGKKTATELSRESKILRTKVYRLLDLLKSKGLVKEELKDNNAGRYFEANSYENISFLLTQKEKELSAVREKLPTMFDFLSTFAVEDQKKTKVFYYTGIEGLKQVMWNASKAKGILRLCELQTLNQFLDYGFYEDIRLEYVKNKVQYLDLVNYKEIEGYTNVRNFVRNCVEHRYIAPERLTLDFEFIIYNDVYTMYNVNSAADIFCLEIHDQKLADMQKQIFNFVWARATKMAIIDDTGTSKLEE